MKYIIEVMSISIVLVPMRLAGAGILVPTSSDRLVTVTNRENLPETTVSATGPATGPWVATAYKANLTFSDPNANPNGSPLAVTATQQSDFSANGVSFSGFIFVDYSGVVPPNLGCTATNRCFATFHIAAPCDYTLGTTITSNNVSETQGSVALFQNGSPLFTQTVSGDRTGTLQVGDYELRILILGGSGGSIAFDGRTDMNVTFSVPAPAAPLALLPLGLLAVRRRRVPSN